MTTMALVPDEGTGSDAAEPVNGEVTRERYKLIAARLREFKSSSKLTWGDIAAQIVVAPKSAHGKASSPSESTLSGFAGGHYPLESARHICAAVERFFAVVDERSGLITNTVYVETSLSTRMLAVIKKAVLLRKMAEIAAESGTGKTRTLQQWWSQNPRAIYLQANATFKTTNGSTFPLLAKLSRAVLGKQVMIGQKPVLYDTLCDALRNTDKPVIVDRAQWLLPAQRDMLCDLHEDADVPVIFGIASDDHQSTAFSSTAGVSFKSRLLREDLRTEQITANDVDLMSEAFGGIDVARDAAPILLKQAQSGGGFRRLINILQLAQIYRQPNQRKVSKENVAAAVHELEISGGAQW